MEESQILRAKRQRSSAGQCKQHASKTTFRDLLARLSCVFLDFLGRLRGAGSNHAAECEERRRIE